MKRVFRTSLTVRLWAVMVLSLFAASCSNDAFFGFEDLEHDTELGFIATFPRKDNTKNMIYAPALKTFKDTLEIRRAVSILSQSLILNNENQLVVSNKVSAGALMWVSDHTLGMDERPFLIDNEGNVVWW